MSTYLIHSPDGNGSSEGVGLPRGCQAVDGTYRAYGPGFPKLLFVLLQRDPQELTGEYIRIECLLLYKSDHFTLSSGFAIRRSHDPFGLSVDSDPSKSERDSNR